MWLQYKGDQFHELLSTAPIPTVFNWDLYPVGHCPASSPSNPPASPKKPYKFITPIKKRYVVLWPRTLSQSGSNQAHHCMTMIFKNYFFVLQVKIISSFNIEIIYICRRKHRDFFKEIGTGRHQRLGSSSWAKISFSLILHLEKPSVHVNLLSKFLRPCLCLLRVWFNCLASRKYYSFCISMSKDTFAVRKVEFALWPHNIKR